MNISVCVIAYNEEKTIGDILSDIKNQDYPHENTELILIDSASTDATKQSMEQFQKKYESEYKGIQVLDNPKKILPCGWNVALLAFTTEAIVRVDAHAKLEKEFVSNSVRCLESGEDVCGGYRPNIIEGERPWQNILLQAESSMFGSSVADYRRKSEKSYVSSVFHGAYRRSVFAKIGGYNENLARTEDNEIHYRMRKHGYRICFDPTIVSYEHTRPNLKRMLKQKYMNGYWIGLTLGVCPGCLSLFHLVPFGFILGILLTTILAVVQMPLLAILMWSAYGILAIGMAILSSVHEKKHGYQLALPFLFFLLHISYGMGTVVGLFKMPFWRRNHKNCNRIEEVKERLN